MISIVIPIYNGEAFIDRCLAQVEGKGHEVVCINDGSTDRTLELLKKHGGVKVISYDENRGTLYARKQGMKAATGDYVTFLDVDDYIYFPPKPLSFTADVVDFDIIERFPGPVQRRRVKEGAPSSEPKAFLRHALTKINLVGRLYKKKLVEKVLKYLGDEFQIYGEDVYLQAMLLHLAESFETTSEIGYGVKVVFNEPENALNVEKGIKETVKKLGRFDSEYVQGVISILSKQCERLLEIGKNV